MVKYLIVRICRVIWHLLAESRTRIENLIKEGKTAEEVIAADPTKDLFKGALETLLPKYFVYSVYQDL